MRTIQRRIVSALLISTDNKILMGMKDPSKGGVYSDCWHIPGGGVDNNEEDIETLKREVLEETGINIEDSIIELADNQGNGHAQKTLPDGEVVLSNMKFIVYKVLLNKNSTDIKYTPADDLVKLEWFDLDKLDQVKLTPPSIELFKRIKLI